MPSKKITIHSRFATPEDVEAQIAREATGQALAVSYAKVKDLTDQDVESVAYIDVKNITVAELEQVHGIVFGAWPVNKVPPRPKQHKGLLARARLLTGRYLVLPDTTTALMTEGKRKKTRIRTARVASSHGKKKKKDTPYAE